MFRDFLSAIWHDRGLWYTANIQLTEMEGFFVHHHCECWAGPLRWLCSNLWHQTMSVFSNVNWKITEAQGKMLNVKLHCRKVKSECSDMLDVHNRHLKYVAQLLEHLLMDLIATG